jgi:hypothetical protein
MSPPTYDGMSWYDVLQVCLNGHKITEMLKSHPENGMDYCPNCGAATISNCKKCHTTIQGYKHMSGVIFPGSSVPAFCHVCGNAYPWTEARLEAARELAEETEGLTKEDRQTLSASLDDLVRDTPRTTLAAARFKRIAAKAGKASADAFKEILIRVISETAKKLIWP